MPIERSRFVRSILAPADSLELQLVDQLAEHLEHHLETRTIAISHSHIHGAPSSAIQAIVSALLRDELGFSEEVVITPSQGFVSSARPDFFLRLGTGNGIIAEVERGGTVNNNHDLKDLWKAHVAPEVQHLFLIVPNANWKPDGSPRERPYNRVCQRLSAFFGDPRKEIDLTSLHVFGYGEINHS